MHISKEKLQGVRWNHSPLGVLNCHQECSVSDMTTLLIYVAPITWLQTIQYMWRHGTLEAAVNKGQWIKKVTKVYQVWIRETPRRT